MSRRKFHVGRLFRCQGLQIAAEEKFGQNGGSRTTPVGNEERRQGWITFRNERHYVLHDRIRVRIRVRPDVKPAAIGDLESVQGRGC